MEILLLYYRFAYDMIERVLLRVVVTPISCIEWLSWRSTRLMYPGLQTKSDTRRTPSIRLLLSGVHSVHIPGKLECRLAGFRAAVQLVYDASGLFS